ncbi:MAG: hypothetical protein HQL54_10135 [Magnetococcales bacterium]|nr:hypothetical protein [Magnetococcales bacterium]
MNNKHNTPLGIIGLIALAGFIFSPFPSVEANSGPWSGPGWTGGPGWQQPGPWNSGPPPGWQPSSPPPPNSWNNSGYPGGYPNQPPPYYGGYQNRTPPPYYGGYPNSRSAPQNWPSARQPQPSYPMPMMGHGPAPYGGSSDGGMGSPFSHSDMMQMKQALGVRPDQEKAWNQLVQALAGVKSMADLESPSVQKAYHALHAVLDPRQQQMADSFKDSLIF